MKSSETVAKGVWFGSLAQQQQTCGLKRVASVVSKQHACATPVLSSERLKAAELLTCFLGRMKLMVSPAQQAYTRAAVLRANSLTVLQALELWLHSTATTHSPQAPREKLQRISHTYHFILINNVLQAQALGFFCPLPSNHIYRTEKCLTKQQEFNY